MILAALWASGMTNEEVFLGSSSVHVHTFIQLESLSLCDALFLLNAFILCMVAFFISVSTVDS